MFVPGLRRSVTASSLSDSTQPDPQSSPRVNKGASSTLDPECGGHIALGGMGQQDGNTIVLGNIVFEREPKPPLCC
jgi:hypothetical protein